MKLKVEQWNTMYLRPYVAKKNSEDQKEVQTEKIKGDIFSGNDGIDGELTTNKPFYGFIKLLGRYGNTISLPHIKQLSMNLLCSS